MVISFAEPWAQKYLLSEKEKAKAERKSQGKIWANVFKNMIMQWLLFCTDLTNIYGANIMCQASDWDKGLHPQETSAVWE